MAGDVLQTFVSCPPHPALAGDVVGYQGYAEYSPAPLRRRELPGPRVPVIISFGDTLSVRSAGGGIAGGALTSFVAGFHDTHAVTEYVGGQCGLQVDLAPLGAHRLLGLAGADLRDGSLRLGDVFGREGDELVARLVEAPDWAARFALADAFLLRRSERARAVDPEVGWAWDRLCETGGRLRIAALAGELGWSRRHLATRFRHQAGLGPKETARVLRFSRAVRLLGGDGAPPSLSDLAAGTGYADHSHLVREFRALAGCTPSQLAAELRGTSAVPV